MREPGGDQPKVGAEDIAQNGHEQVGAGQLGREGGPDDGGGDRSADVYLFSRLRDFSCTSGPRVIK